MNGSKRPRSWTCCQEQSNTGSSLGDPQQAHRVDSRSLERVRAEDTRSASCQWRCAASARRLPSLGTRRSRPEDTAITPSEAAQIAAQLDCNLLKVNDYKASDAPVVRRPVDKEISRR